jgi:uncharacterized protein (DUF427 family)
VAQVTFDGTVIAEGQAVEKMEGRRYFPRQDVDTSVLEPSTTAYTCPWKGAAQYYHVRIGERRIVDGAWSYPDAKPAARAIAGHLAFDVRAGLEVT